MVFNPVYGVPAYANPFKLAPYYYDDLPADDELDRREAAAAKEARARAAA